MLDAVVVGGGAAGLALVGHLAAGGWDDRRVVLVDDPSPTTTDRCWGSWSVRPRLTAAPGDDAAFDRVRVHALGRDLPVDLAPYRYRLVPWPALRAAVAALTADAPGFERVQGRCTAVVDGEDGARVSLGDRTLHARWVFDSSGTWTPDGGRRRPAAQGHRMVFTGWDVALPANLVDPDVPVLCDFRVPPGHAAFVHVLPSGPRNALVEHTAYVPAGSPGPPPAEVDAVLGGYVRDVLGVTGPWRVDRREHGVIPLHPGRRRRRGRHVLAIGAPAGLVRASSGYGFDAVHRDAAAVVRSLAVHGHPFDVPPPRRRDVLLDTVFLRALARDPRTLERAFGALFAARDPLRVLRFLDGDATAADVARMIADLPVPPFVRALLPAGHRRRRRAGGDAGTVSHQGLPAHESVH